MDQNRTPLLDALLGYQKKQRVSFHVPGHKDGIVFPKKGKDTFQKLLSIDSTELEGLDDLYQPQGPILEAQNLLADYYQTGKSYFLVNGSTVGNLTMILSTCRAGDRVLVQRNSHKSIFNAVQLSQTNPVFLSPVIDEETELPVGITKKVVLEALDKYPDAKALILTYPNYYGMAAEDCQEVIETAKDKGLRVLVDEAHGAHFKLGQPVPESSLTFGADIVVHSAHKTLPAMTMGSYLHIHRDARDLTDSVEKYLSMLQSSSPSYPIMASLDLARHYMASIPERMLQRILAHIKQLESQLQEIPQIHVVTGEGYRYKRDPFKILLQSSSDVSGYMLQKRFMSYGIYPELADPMHVLLILGISDQLAYSTVPHIIKQALNDLPSRRRQPNGKKCMPEPMASLALNYDQMQHLTSIHRPITEAENGISAEDIIPYPPGIPIVLKGERLTDRSIEMIQYWRHAGARFQSGKAVQEGKISVFDL
ncbi:arginine/lysine/ornithine decarboxylase [Scopulibacillus daqui]|uniref:Arginine/lysine/ornithine decarboxylase n=1 Tax=Scopulibacillus daqui TaxID=1469162 RepID=A0ABS2Q2H2_9BACL|nr:aminotransferase class I/II-fold pyridoxal phosphate-dependent enzyme [Scopulibacillus daqui]MBM7646487.1 arginine/lysine/ornithine decarboxylase [Scopulibacillus daqui]